MAVVQGTHRPFFKTKAAWADARAAELRAEAQSLRARRGPFPSPKPDDPVRRKFQEAAKFDRMASAFRKKGV